MNNSRTHYKPAVIVTTMLCLLLTVGCIRTTPMPRSEGRVVHIGQGELRGAALAVGQHPYIVAALSFNGAISLSGDGEILDHYEPDDVLTELVGVAVSGIYETGESEVLLVAMVDFPRFRIIMRGLDPASGRFIGPEIMVGNGTVTVPPRTTHACFARDQYDNSLYMFAGGDHGRLLQFRIFSTEAGRIEIRELQELVIGGPTTACTSNDREGLVYVTEPAMGLWQVITDPEEVPLRVPVALNSPYGVLGEPVAVAGVTQDDRYQVLLVDVGRDRFLRLDQDGGIVSEQGFNQAFGGNAVNGSIAGIATGQLPVQGRVQDVIAVAVSGGALDGDIHILPLEATISASSVPGHSSPDAVVSPRTLSAPVSSGMDAADDPAIWVNPIDPGRSLILGADKGAGLGVYDLDGRLLQFLSDGRINNVDVRPGFTEYPTLAHLAVASDRTRTALAIYAIDGETRYVSRVEARTIPAGFNDVYGLCMYRSPHSGEVYAFATSDDGQFNQWRLFPRGPDKVDAELVRHVKIGTMTEACVVDDENGYLYVAEERVGVWRYGAEPGAGEQRVAVVAIEAGGPLTADLEGLAIYKSDKTDGYLVVTSQGSDNYSVYERLPPHAYRGTFRIRANARDGIDGTSQTDGIDITNLPLPGYPRGLLVAQDGRYDQSQDFKYVSWEEIARALGLE